MTISTHHHFRNGDLIANQIFDIAKELGLGMSTHPVDVSDDPSGLPVWVFAQRAYARNTLIAEECDVLIACWDGSSRGTKDTINKVSKLGKPVIIV